MDRQRVIDILSEIAHSGAGRIPRKRRNYRKKAGVMVGGMPRPNYRRASGVVVGGRKGRSAWISFVKNYAKQHGISYHEALIEAGPAYHKMYGGEGYTPERCPKGYHRQCYSEGSGYAPKRCPRGYNYRCNKVRSTRRGRGGDAIAELISEMF